MKKTSEAKAIDADDKKYVKVKENEFKILEIVSKDSNIQASFKIIEIT